MLFWVSDNIMETVPTAREVFVKRPESQILFKESKSCEVLQFCPYVDCQKSMNQSKYKLTMETLSTIVFLLQLNSYTISERVTSPQAKHVFLVTKRI